MGRHLATDRRTHPPPCPSSDPEIYSQDWEISLLKAPCQSPMLFCFGCLCGPCAIGRQRYDLIEGDFEKYSCCQGLMGEKCTGYLDKCTGPCPQVCCCLESCCCTGMAVSGNRWVMSYRHSLRTSFFPFFLPFFLFFPTFLTLIPC